MSEQALREKLGAAASDLPDLSSLDDAALDQLMQLVEAAHQTQKQNLRDATEEALNHVPRLLRGAVRKVVLG